MTEVEKPWLLSFYGSALGKKIVMALTGLVLFGFVLGHMAGNLKLYLGEAALDHYAEFLREMGTPLLPHEGLLWIARAVLLGSVLLHIHAAFTLTRLNQKARPLGYEKRQVLEATLGSRLMRIGGVVIAVFVVFHLLHLTFGTVHPDFESGKVYQNVVKGLGSPLAGLFYIIANVALFFHLRHGLWSLFQSLGWNHPRFNPWRRTFATTFALIVAVGNISFPLAIWFKLVG